MSETVSIEPFQLDSTESLPIRGVIHRPGQAKAVVVMVHGFKGFREWNFFPWLAGELAAMSLVVCRYDSSRNGIGVGSDYFERLDLFADDTYGIQLADLAVVLRHLQTIPDVAALPVILFGHSRGGAIALLGAAQTPRLAAVVTWSSIANCDRWDAATRKEWRRTGEIIIENQRTKQLMRVSTRLLDDFEAYGDRYDIARAVEHLDAPILVLHGTKDETVPSEDAKAIAQRGKNATVVLVEGGSHTFGAIHPLIHVPETLRQALAATTRFIGKVLGG